MATIETRIILSRGPPVYIHTPIKSKHVCDAASKVHYDNHIGFASGLREIILLQDIYNYVGALINKKS